MKAGTEVWKGWTQKPYIPVAHPNQPAGVAARFRRILMRGLGLIRKYWPKHWFSRKGGQESALRAPRSGCGSIPSSPISRRWRETSTACSVFRRRTERSNEWVRFSHGAISPGHDGAQKANVTVTFTDGHALVSFLFSPVRSYLNAFAAGGDPAPLPHSISSRACLTTKSLWTAT